MPRLMNALLLLLFGCPTADYTKPVVPPTATYQDPALDLTGASEVFQLHLKPGTYDLPDNSRPKGALTGTRFEVSAEPTDSGWLAKLPFDVGSQGRRFAPPGMVVTVDGNEAPYGKVGVQSWYCLLYTSPSPRDS